MDYKKALAATAVTTAAFVVPIVAQAEETGQPTITGSNTFKVTYTYSDGTSFNADGSAIFDKKVKAKVISLPDMTDAIASYQWYIVDNNKYEAITGETSTELMIPYKLNGKELALEVITEKGEHLWSEDHLSVAPFEVDETNLNVEFLVNGESIIIDDESKKSATLSPGDRLTVKNFAIKGMNGEVLSSEYYTVTYKWYAVLKDDVDEKIKDDDEAKNNKVKVLLPDVTGASYTIPVGNDSEYAGFYVRAVLSIPTLLMIDTNSYSLPLEKYISLDADPATELNKEIEELIDPDSYGNKYEFNGSFVGSDDEDEDEHDFTENQLFESYINSLNSRYENLSTNSKNLVTNYSILQGAKNDVQVVKTLITELKNFDSIFATATNHAELLKQFDKIQRSYNALTPLQHSIVNFTKYNEQYLYRMQELLKKSEVYPVASEDPFITVNQVKVLNNDIASLMNNTDKKYNLDESSENILEDFTKQIKDLTSRTKLIDKNYQPLLYTSILKTAESDVKKANAVITRLQQIPKAKTEAKQISAIISAKKAYDQLTPYQESLVDAFFENNTEDGDLESLLTLPESGEEQFDVSTIVTNIADLKVDGVYSLTASELEERVKQISEEYLSLSPKAKKLVTNYSVLTQVKKDYTATNKVILLMEKAENAASLIDSSDDKNLLKNQKAALTKYTSAYKAYIKLTNSQKSIVQNGDIDVQVFIDDYNDLTIAVKTPVFKEDDEKAAEKFDEYNSENVSELIVSIEDMFKDSASVDEIESKINEAKAAYKKLTSYEKKLVYNYAYLSVASSHVSKAKTVQTKLKTATEKNDAKKIAAAITSYNKLDLVQQKLIAADYLAAQTALGITNDDLGELSELLSQLSDEQYYTFDNINKISKLMDVLSSREQKALSDYDKYQAALKDLKAVNTLISKVEKLGESPSYSNKDSIITSYQKLTKKQLLIFKDANNEAVQKIAQWTLDLKSNTSELNTLIGSINVYGQYMIENMNGATTSYTSIGDVDDQSEGITFLDNFNKFLVNIEAVYKKLDSKEKKLVTHYSMIATAKKDSKAVRSVVELALAYDAITDDEDAKSAAFKKWNKAYSKLTYQQQSLFDLAMPNFKE